MGKVYKSNNLASFAVLQQKDINKIIEIFSKTPLNTIKQLNEGAVRERSSYLAAPSPAVFIFKKSF